MLRVLAVIPCEESDHEIAKGYSETGGLERYNSIYLPTAVEFNNDCSGELDVFTHKSLMICTIILQDLNKLKSTL